MEKNKREKREASGMQRNEFTLRVFAVRCVAMALLLFAPGVALRGQTKMTPNEIENKLKEFDGRKTCSGTRAVGFDGDKVGGKRLRLRVYAWIGAGNLPAVDDNNHRFKLYDVTGGRREEKASVGFITQLNILTNNYQVVPGSSNWRYVEVDVEPTDLLVGNNYELINTGNVFHIGYMEVSAGAPPTDPLTSQFEMLSSVEEYATDKLETVTYRYQEKFKSGWQTVDASRKLQICSQDSVLINVAVLDAAGNAMPNDRFDYNWHGGVSSIGIRSPDSVESYVYMSQTGATLRVDREGMCDLKATGEVLTIEAVKGLAPKLDGDDYLCDEKKNLELKLEGAKGAEVSWEIRYAGSAPGFYQPYDQKVPTRVAANDPEPYHVPLEYGANTGTITHELRVVAKMGACEKATVKEVKMYPQFNKPKIELVPADNTIDLTKPVCSPLKLAVVRDLANTQPPAGKVDYVWSLNGESRSNQTEITTVPEFSATFPGKEEKIKISLSIKVQEQANCEKHDDKEVTLYPQTRAQGISKFFDQGGNETQSRCVPLKIEATCESEPAAPTSGTLTPKYRWQYMYEGDPNPDGTPKWVDWGNTKTIKAPETVAGTGMYYFREYKSKASGDPYASVLRLTYTNEFGCESTKELALNLQPAPEVEKVDLDKTAGCSPLQLKATAVNVVRGGEFHWQVFDGTNPVSVTSPGASVGTMPSVSASNQVWSDFVIANQDVAKKNYTVRFTVRHPESACFASAETTVEVAPKVGIVLDHGDLKICPRKDGKAELWLKDKSNYPGTANPPKWQIMYDNDPPAAAVDATPVPMGGGLQFQAENLNTDKVRTGKLILIADGGGVCETSKELPFTLYPRVNPEIKLAENKKTNAPLVDNGKYCAPFSGNFVGEGARDLYWHIEVPSLRAMQTRNNESTGVEYPFINESPNPEVVRVALVGTNEYHCTDSAEVHYTINPSVALDFSMKPIEKCNPMRVELKRQVSGGANLTDADFEWEGAPNVVPGDFTQAGTQTITLKLKGGKTKEGCDVAPVTKTIEVPDKLEPKVSDITGAKSYCAGDKNKVEFKNESTGTAMEYLWEFGDGQTKSVKGISNETHVFSNTTNAKKVCTVKLTAINTATGCRATSTGADAVEVTIYPEAIPRLALTSLNNCAPRKVRIVDQGSSGCEKYKVSFKSSDAGAKPIVDDEWLFGPPTGTTYKDYELANKDKTAPVSYSAEVLGYKVWPGGVTCESKPIELAKIPVEASFELKVEKELQVCGGTPAELNASTPLSTGIVYDWSFDDGATWQELESPVTRTFENNGSVSASKKVKVRAHRKTDLAGACAATEEVNVVVRPRVEARIAVVGDVDRCTWPTPFEFKNASQCAEPASAETSFTWHYESASGTYSNTEDIKTLESRKWDFAPEGKTNATKYTITLNATQKYTLNGVALTCASAGPASAEVEVLPELKPAFTLSRTQGCAPLAITATDKTEGGKDIKLTWGYGPGSGVERGKDVDIEFQNAAIDPKTYPVTLSVINEYGCKKEAVPQNVTVYPEVIAAFNFKMPKKACPPYDLEFDNISKNADTWEWSCLAGGAGGFPQTTVTPSPVQVKNETGQPKEYKFELKASKDYGGANGTCSSTKVKTLVVRPELKVEASPIEEVGCSPLKVQFTGKVSGADSDVPYWDFGNGRTKGATAVVEEFTNSSREKDTVFNGTVTAVYGECTASVPIKITVFPKVEAMFATTSTDGCTPLEVKVSDVVTSSRYTYSWSAEGSNQPLSSVANPGTFRYVNSLDPLAVLEKKLTLKVNLTDHPQCNKSMEVPVKVFPGIKPSFTIDPGACSPFTPNVQNETQTMSGQLTAYTWKFYTGGQKVLELKGGQPVPQLTNPSHDVEQKYEVWLIARSEHGCGDSLMREVSVWPKPLVSIELDGANESCPPYDAKFINKSLGSDLTFTYAFGDGKEEMRTDLSSVTHTYDNLTQVAQPYPMKLTAKNKFGCSDEKETTITVFSNPQANFEVQEGYESCSPFLVSMLDKSKNGASYKWSFGDGKESTMPSPVHQFENNTPSDIAYDVTLRVETKERCAAEKTRAVTVYATPKAEFSVNPPLQVFKDPSVQVEIEDLTKPTSPSWQYGWDFGNGQTSAVHAPGAYEYTNWAHRDSSFAYTVSLKVNSPKCESKFSKKVFVLAPAPNTEFSALDYAACAPFDLRLNNKTKREYVDSCLWDFGDGKESKEFNPMHRYEEPGLYHVTLKAWGEGGEASAYRIVEVYKKPKAQFEILPTKVMLPTARVKANNLTEAVLESFWDFGDGYTSTEHSPMHEYAHPGEYAVKLEVKSTQGCTGDTLISPAVVVLDEGYIRFPTAFVPSTTGPNGGYYDEFDKENKVFHPVWGGVVRYKLMIFNRWGEKLFESNDIKVGWDGYFAGKVCMTGVYAWRAVGEYYNGEMFDLRGNVTLLR